MSADSLSSIAAVVFDFDGVLADTEGLHLSAFQRVFQAKGWHLDEQSYYDRYLGCDDVGLVVSFAQDREVAVADHEVRTLVEDKGRVFAGLVAAGDVLYPGARECVERLSARFALGIASGALHGEIEAILDAAGLRSRFRTIVAADDVTATKPSPEPYLAAARQLGVAPALCVAVEDSAPGLASARAAGMRTVAVTTTTPRHLLDAADRVIGQLAELSPDLVEALGSGAPLW